MRDSGNLPGKLSGLLVALSLIPLAPGCDGKSPTTPSLPEGDVTWEILLQQDTSATKLFRREVVRTEPDLEDLWLELQTTTALPTVDFNVDMVVVVASGEQSNGCYDIEVTAVVSDGTDITVTVTERTPTTTCVCTPEVVQPVEVIKLPRANLVSFNNLTVATCAT